MNKRTAEEVLREIRNMIDGVLPPDDQKVKALDCFPHKNPPAYRKLRIGLIIGHNPINKGAKGRSLAAEYDFWSSVARRLNGPAETYEVIYVPNEGSYNNKHKALKDFADWPLDYIFELHYNAYFTSDANGFEVLTNYAHYSSEAALIARNLRSAYMDNLINIKSRGVKHLTKGNRGFNNLNQGNINLAPKYGYFIIEPFFGTSTNDINELTRFAQTKSYGSHRIERAITDLYRDLFTRLADAKREDLIKENEVDQPIS